jgi:hypothetical protein
MMRSMRTLTDQVANLLKGGNTQAPPVYHELGAQTSGMVCSNCGMPGHTNQLCHQQKQQSQPYRPPQVRTNLGNLKPRYAYHELCRGRYALGQCWLKITLDVVIVEISTPMTVVAHPIKSFPCSHHLVTTNSRPKTTYRMLVIRIQDPPRDPQIFITIIKIIDRHITPMWGFKQPRV